MKKHFLSVGLMVLSGLTMAQTSHWNQTFNAVSNNSFKRIGMMQGYNIDWNDPEGPGIVVTSLFTVAQTQHNQIGSQVIPATAQPRYSFGGGCF